MIGEVSKEREINPGGVNSGWPQSAKDKKRVNLINFNSEFIVSSRNRFKFRF